MRLARSYAVLSRVAQRRLGRLRVLTMRAAKVGHPEANRLLSYVTVETLSAWSEFCRHYVLSLALEPRSCSGRRVRLGVPGINAPADVLGVAMRALRPRRKAVAPGVWERRDEPAWHDPNALLTCATELKVSNLPEIRGALSVPTGALRDLVVFRNFFGHRNATTYRSASDLAIRYGIPSGHPVSVLLSKPMTRPYPLLAEWIDDLGVVVELLCE